jgi:carbon monoxide dehydrogenase subunit G
MHFTATEEVAAPIDTVWRHVSDFDRFEAAIRGRGGKAERQESGPVGPGTRWACAAEAMGKVRAVDVVLERLDVPQALTALASAEGVDVTIDVALERLAPDRTRMTVTADAQARTLGAKLVLKPLSLAQPRLRERYEARIAGFARRIERA